MGLINSAFYEDLSHIKILYKEDLYKIISSFSLYKDNYIIYCKTDFIYELFNHIKLSSKKYILITHHSDHSIDSLKFSLKPSNIKKWFAINTNFYHNDLIPIPLGTKTPEGRAYHEERYKIKWFENSIDNFINKEKINKCYCNWNNTNPQRNNIIKKIENKIPYKWSYGLSFEDYIEEMSSYRFVISPEGNGIDNHRTWEALYVNSIPIVIKNMIYDHWKTLPILQVSDYSDLNEDILENFYKEKNKYSKEELDPSFWKEKILSEYNKIK